jgi:hypothetical protein
VSRFGTNEDVDTMLQISDKAWGELEDIAAAAAIRLSTNPEQLAIEMAKSDSRSRNKAALAWLLEQDSSEIRGYFRGVLHDPSDVKRLQGVQYLSDRLSRPELQQILDEYPGDGTYYYNVVTWLDRSLYAPSPLKGMFAEDLRKEVKGVNAPITLD